MLNCSDALNKACKISNPCLTFAFNAKCTYRMNKNEEYQENRGRDRLIFLVSTVAMVGFLILKPEWVWVVWPFQFTAAAGMLGRL
jgi:hypothetical protein